MRGQRPAGSRRLSVGPTAAGSRVDTPDRAGRPGGDASAASCAIAVRCFRGSRRLRGGRCGEGQGMLPVHRVVRYIPAMSRVYSARVRGGVVVPDGVTLPDGASVTIAVNDEREAEVELSPAELAELEEAIAEADRSESVSSAVVLAELDHIAPSREADRDPCPVECGSAIRATTALSVAARVAAAVTGASAAWRGTGCRRRC